MPNTIIMKVNHFLFAILASILIGHATHAQNKAGVDSTGLPGDNFSLQGALATFQKASSLEEFEKMLNSQDNHVNNLDLNGDGDIDYIRVIDNTEKGAHAIVLQAVVSDKESQDIAVIELEKTGDTTATVQIVGDEDIYGEQVIIEPGNRDNDDAFNNYVNDHIASRGPNVRFNYDPPGIVVNVWMWPSVRFVYAPIYRPWISPYRWHYYPGWWRPWRPFAWHVWHPYYRPYYAHYMVVRTHRVVYAHQLYLPHRVTSVMVTTRHAEAVNNYRVTKTKTTVIGPHGHGGTRVRTTITGPGGHIRTHTNFRRH